MAAVDDQGPSSVDDGVQNSNSDNDDNDLNIESDDVDQSPSNEALPLLTSELKRRRLSEEQNLTSNFNSPYNGMHSNLGMLVLESNSQGMQILGTEAVARDVRIMLRQLAMRQTDLAPFIGCRPGSVAGVIAKAKVPWSQLNEFNKKVFLAMAKWLEDKKRELNLLPNLPPLSNSSFINSPTSSSSSAPLAPSYYRNAVTPDLMKYSVAQSSSPAPSLNSFQQNDYSQPWATAKFVANPGYFLLLENLYMVIPGRGTLIAGAMLSLAAGKRYALIGSSECGSSSLMRFIAAKEDLNIPVEMEITLCDQSSADGVNDLAENMPAVDYVVDFDRRWRKLKSEEASLELLVKNGNNAEAFVRLRHIYEQLCFFGSGSAKAKARQLLTGLGFSHAAQDNLLGNLGIRSQKVANLARALFSESPLLLIDRPTNFLDINSIMWLENFLLSWPGTVVVATQDRAFMDAICSTIIYFHNQQLFYYQGNYSSFKQQISPDKSCELKITALN